MLIWVRMEQKLVVFVDSWDMVDLLFLLVVIIYSNSCRFIVTGCYFEHKNTKNITTINNTQLLCTINRTCWHEGGCNYDGYNTATNNIFDC